MLPRNHTVSPGPTQITSVTVAWVISRSGPQGKGLSLNMYLRGEMGTLRESQKGVINPLITVSNWSFLENLDYVKAVSELL